MSSYVGPYRILRLIEQGGQGSVYLGYDERLQRKVAVKVHALPLERKSRRARLREARLVAGLQSPKIVQIYDVIESDTHLGMVMEYIPGCSLEEFLQVVKPSLASVLTIATDIAAALTAAQQAGIVHGDVKAANVLLTDSGRAKLADFGIAHKAASQHFEPGRPGSLSALSPEQYGGEVATQRSDIFAFGILLYRMLSGVHPFYRDSRFEPDLLLGTEPPPPITAVGDSGGLPHELLGLVAESLRKNPDERLQSALRARQVLMQISRGLPAVAAGSLLREARPVFRSDFPEDLPPQIPGGFSRQARAHFIGSGNVGSRLWHGLKSLPWSGRFAVSCALLLFLALPVAAAMHFRTTVIQFEEPTIQLSKNVDLSRDIDRELLLWEMKTALAERLGRLDVIGDVDAGPRTVVYSRRAELLRPQLPEQAFSIELSCVETLCVLAARRETEKITRLEQVAVIADIPAEEWRRVVQDVTHSLFD